MAQCGSPSLLTQGGMLIAAILVIASAKVAVGVDSRGGVLAC